MTRPRTRSRDARGPPRRRSNPSPLAPEHSRDDYRDDVLAFIEKRVKVPFDGPGINHAVVRFPDDARREDVSRCAA